MGSWRLITVNQHKSDNGWTNGRATMAGTPLIKDQFRIPADANETRAHRGD